MTLVPGEETIFLKLHPNILEAKSDASFISFF